MSYALPCEATQERTGSMADELRVALEGIYRASLAWSHACCRYDPSEAEDVLQVSYQKVIEGKARFDGRSSPRTWFFSVIRRTAAERRRRALFSLDTLKRVARAAVELPPEPSPEEPLLETERARQVRSLLGSLPARQREVLELVFYQELTVEESAQVMGISVGSARVHYHRGKERCVRLLKATGLSPGLSP